MLCSCASVCVCVLMCVSKVDLKFPCFLLITESVLFSWRSVRWEIDGRWTAIKRSLIANKRGFITATGMQTSTAAFWVMSRGDGALHFTLIDLLTHRCASAPKPSEPPRQAGFEGSTLQVHYSDKGCSKQQEA